MYGVKEVKCASDIIDNECYVFQILYFFSWSLNFERVGFNLSFEYISFLLYTRFC